MTTSQQYPGGFATLDSNKKLKLAEAPAGLYAGAITFDYLFDNGTSNADPGAGKFRFNNSTENVATALYIDTTTNDSIAVAAILDTLDASTNVSTKGELRIWKKTDQTAFLLFEVTSRTSHSGYREYALSIVASSASGPFSNGDECMISFCRAGDAGVGTGVTVFEVDGTVVAVTGVDIAFNGTWSSSTAYTVGSVVTYNGSSYVCIVGNTNNVPPTTPADWQLLSQGVNFTGTWSGSTAYNVDDVVVLNSACFICILAHTNHAPPNGTYWSVLAQGFNFLNAWLAITAYNPYDVVTSGGATYVCILAHTNNVPPNATYWSVLAAEGTPASADAFSNGGVTITDLTVNVLINGVAPVGELQINGGLIRSNFPCMQEIGLSGGQGTLSSATQRAFATVYQNTTGYPLLVIAACNSSSGNCTYTAFADSSVSPTTAVFAATSPNTSNYAPVSLAFIVLPGQFYKCTGSTGTLALQFWREWKLINGAVTDSGDISGSRSLSTVFQNTTGKTLVLIAQVSGVSSSSLVQGYSDQFSLPTSQVDEGTQTSSGSQTCCILMIVPPGYYYKVTAASGSLAHWHEYAWAIQSRRSTNLVSSTGFGTSRTSKAAALTINTGVGTVSTAAVQAYANQTSKMRWVQTLSTGTTTPNQMFMFAGASYPAGVIAFIQTINGSTGKRRTFSPVSPGDWYANSDNTASSTMTDLSWFEYELG